MRKATLQHYLYFPHHIVLTSELRTTLRVWEKMEIFSIKFHVSTNSFSSSCNPLMMRSPIRFPARIRHKEAARDVLKNRRGAEESLVVPRLIT